MPIYKVGNCSNNSAVVVSSLVHVCPKCDKVEIVKDSNTEVICSDCNVEMSIVASNTQIKDS